MFVLLPKFSRLKIKSLFTKKPENGNLHSSYLSSVSIPKTAFFEFASFNKTKQNYLEYKIDDNCRVLPNFCPIIRKLHDLQTSINEI